MADVITVDGSVQVITAGAQGPPGPQGATGPPGPAATPVGSAGSVQYSAGGVLGGSTNLVWDVAANKFVVKATSGQSGDLLELQDNTGAVLSKFDSAGRLVIGSNVTKTAPGLSLLGYSTSAGDFGGGIQIGDGNTLKAGLYRDGGNYFHLYASSLLSVDTAFGAVVSNSSATNVPLTVQGASGQSANLQQWVNGGAKLAVASDGRLIFPGNNTLDGTFNGVQFANVSGAGLSVYSLTHSFYAASDYSTVRLSINSQSSVFVPASAGYPALVARAKPSQTGNVQEWQDSTGAAVAYLTADGRTLALGDNRLAIGNGASTAATDCTAVGCYSSATGLFATALGKDASAGTLGVALGSGATAGYSGNAVGARCVGSGGWTTLLSSDNNSSGSPTGIIVQKHSASNDIRPQIVVQGSWADAADATRTAQLQLQVYYTTAAQTGLTIRAGSGGTPTVSVPHNGLWDVSDSSVLVGYDSGNNYTARSSNAAGSAYYGIGTAGNTAGCVYIQAKGANAVRIDPSGTAKFNPDGTNTASAAVVVAKGSASQSGNLLECQDSTGASLVTVSANGFVDVVTSGASGVPLAVKKNTSQPGVVVYNQDQSFLSAAWLAHNNTTSALGNTAYHGLYCSSDSWVYLAGAVGTGGAKSVKWSTDGTTFPLSIDTTGRVLVTSTASTRVPLKVQGAASQSANLFEAQDSTGAAVASIDPAGQIYAPALRKCSGIYDGYNSQALGFDGNYVHSYRATTVEGWVAHPELHVLQVKAAGGQTGDLQQWQNSTGTALAKVDANGGIVPASMSDTTAANGTLYYSTTQSKHCIKDSSGTVHPALLTLTKGVGMALQVSGSYDTPIGTSVTSTYWRWVGLGIDVSKATATVTLYGYVDAAAFAAGKQSVGQKQYTVAAEQFGTFAGQIDGATPAGLSTAIYGYVKAHDTYFANATDA